MDPGTALAIVSLVYDVTKDLYEYYRAWKDCDNDVAELRQQLLALHSMFRVLRKTLQRHELAADKTQLVYDAIGRCNDVANELRDKLQKFPSKDSPASALDKLRAKGRRFLYPFRESTVMALKEDLALCREELQGAVGVVTLDAALGASQQLVALDKRLVDSSEKLENAVDDLSQQLAREMQGLSIGIGKSLKGIHDRLEMEERRRTMAGILDWLCPTDYSQQQNDLFDRRSATTGDWLFESPEFQAWSQGSSSSMLFCPGDPGAGKTIMTATVIRHLLKADKMGVVATIYMYFNYKQESQQSLTHVLSALLRQLVYARGAVPETLAKSYQQYLERQTRLNQQENEKELLDLISGFTRVNILVDALDECRTTDHIRSDVITAIKKINLLENAYVLVTSRPVPDITCHFHGAVFLEIRASDGDLAHYLEAQLIHSSKAVRDSQYFQEIIVNTIVKNVKGIFLLAYLFVEYFRQIKKPNAVVDALKSLEMQSELDRDIYHKAYTGAIERILAQSCGDRVLALEALVWITRAQRPLTPIELEHALAIQLDDSAHRLDEGNVVSCEEIISCCAGLVTEDKQTGIIRLVHFTTQTFLEQRLKEGIPDLPVPDSLVALKCLKYLSFGALATGPCTKYSEYRKRLTRDPFLGYAARFWGVHVRHCEDRDQEGKHDDPIFTLAVPFLNCAESVKSASQIIRYSDSYVNWPATQRFHLLAEFGIARLFVAMMKDEDIGIDATDRNDQTPLSLAARNGNEAVVELLLATNQVDVNSRDFLGKTPLSWAAENGHEVVVQVLLATNQVDVNVRDSHGHTPLSLAAKNSHPTVVELLLATKQGDVNSCDYYRYALSWAARNGNEAVVELLLATNQIDVNARDILGKTPLSWAIQNGHEVVVRLLLATNQVDVNSYDCYSYTPLSQAAMSGHKAIVELLLATNQVKIDSCDRNGRTPLSLAAENGHEAVLQLLLATNRVDVNSRDNFHGYTPLSWAAENGHEAVMQLLLATNQVQIDSCDRNGRTPLSLAAENGHEAVLQLLLATNQVDVNSRDNFYGYTPLSWAAENGHEAVVQLLLATDRINVDSCDDTAGHRCHGQQKTVM